MSLSWPSDAQQDEEDDDADEEDLSRYAVAESSVLLHHAAETLFRLYLAHRELPPCPWLEVSRLRNFAAFKKQAEALSHKPTAHDAVLGREGAPPGIVLNGSAVA